MRLRINHLSRLVFVIAALSLSTAMSSASFQSMGQRLPAQANAIVAINVAKVLETPYAKAEWTPSTIDAWAKQPVMIPPGARRLLMAAEVQSSSMESYWEMALTEFAPGKLPDVKAMAAAEGGTIDRVWDLDAVASPINAYFVPLDRVTLASITPANRSAIAKWVRTPTSQPGPGGNVTSEYIRGVVGKLSDQNTDIVMAMDLDGAFGVPLIRRWLDENELKTAKREELDQIARTLGSMKGITLVMNVDKEVKGTATVDFGMEASILGPSAKQILGGVLDAAGLHLDEVDGWDAKANGKQVTFTGAMSTPSLRKLLGIVQSPIPAATAVAKDGQPNTQGAIPADPAQASQRYFKVICGNLDNFKATSSPSAAAQWARATSKRIDQLPILNVDPVLVQWGSMVSLKLKQVGAGMLVGQTSMNARVAGITDPSYVGVYDNEGNYHTDVDRAAVEQTKQQRRQAALEQKAAAQQQAAQILQEIAETRPQIRQAMVEKYKVEF
jgi:hypothetical protein